MIDTTLRWGKRMMAKEHESETDRNVTSQIIPLSEMTQSHVARHSAWLSLEGSLIKPPRVFRVLSYCPLRLLSAFVRVKHESRGVKNSDLDLDLEPPVALACL